MTAGKPVCGANLRGKPGKTCQQTILSANGRCRLHGGKAVAGIASGTFKHGRYSKVLPARLKTTFDSIDPTDAEEILNLSSMIAVYESRFVELLGNLDTMEASARTKAVVARWEDLEKAQRMPAATPQDQDRKAQHIAIAISDLRDAIYTAAEDWQVWDDINKASATIKNLASYETARREKAFQVVSTEHALGLFTELVTLVRANISDPEVLRAIQKGMTEIIGE